MCGWLTVWLSVSKANDFLKELNALAVNKENIIKKYLGKKGLHLSSSSVARLTNNYIAIIRKFWKQVGDTNSFDLIPINAV